MLSSSSSVPAKIRRFEFRTLPFEEAELDETCKECGYQGVDVYTYISSGDRSPSHKRYMMLQDAWLELRTTVTVQTLNFEGIVFR